MGVDLGRHCRPAAGTTSEPAFLEIDEGLHQFLPRVHHERAVADDGFIQGFSGHHQHFGVAAGLQMQLLAFLTQHDKLRFTRLGELAGNISQKMLTQMPGIVAAPPVITTPLESRSAQPERRISASARL
mgnify:CR=1 FL=1